MHKPLEFVYKKINSPNYQFGECLLGIRVKEKELFVGDVFLNKLLNIVYVITLKIKNSGQFHHLSYSILNGNHYEGLCFVQVNNQLTGFQSDDFLYLGNVFINEFTEIENVFFESVNQQEFKKATKNDVSLGINHFFIGNEYEYRKPELFTLFGKELFKINNLKMFSFEKQETDLLCRFPVDEVVTSKFFYPYISINYGSEGENVFKMYVPCFSLLKYEDRHLMAYFNEDADVILTLFMKNGVHHYNVTKDFLNIMNNKDNLLFPYSLSNISLASDNIIVSKPSLNNLNFIHYYSYLMDKVSI